MPDVRERRARWSPQLVTGAVLLAAVSLVAVVDPHTSGRYPPCPFHAMTGTWCPGCGGLRAVHDLAHGQVTTAAGENLLVVALVPVLALWWLSTRVRARPAPQPARQSSPRPAPQPAPQRGVLNPPVLVVLAVVVLTFTVLRNLPIGAVLAP